MKKTIFSNFLVSRVILLTAIVYHLINGMLYLAALANYRTVYGIFHQYADLSDVSLHRLTAFFALWSVLYLGMVVLLFALWFRPQWLFFVSVLATNLSITILKLYIGGFDAHFSIIFEWILMTLIGISFSAMILRHLIRIRKAARRIAEMAMHGAKEPKENE